MESFMRADHKEAFDIYEKIPSDRMNGIKGIGFELDDGSIYDGKFDLMRGVWFRMK